MRSHDQYNTTIYGLDDRYRGVRGQRDVLFVNEADIIRLGFQPGQKVDIVSLWGWHVRRVQGFTLLAFDIPAGQAAAYYPEVNPLVPLESIAMAAIRQRRSSSPSSWSGRRTTGVSVKTKKPCSVTVQGFVIKVSDSRKR
jgi:anaerobic selenocysteine-containing dehydrogenase